MPYELRKPSATISEFSKSGVNRSTQPAIGSRINEVERVAYVESMPVELTDKTYIQTSGQRWIECPSCYPLVFMRRINFYDTTGLSYMMFLSGRRRWGRG